MFHEGTQCLLEFGHKNLTCIRPNKYALILTFLVLCNTLRLSFSFMARFLQSLKIRPLYGINSNGAKVIKI